ncbi:hypothetical protein VIGAN_01201000, partial [Vigna angularis var. angularis]
GIRNLSKFISIHLYGFHLFHCLFILETIFEKMVQGIKLFLILEIFPNPWEPHITNLPPTTQTWESGFLTYPYNKNTSALTLLSKMLLYLNKVHHYVRGFQSSNAIHSYAQAKLLVRLGIKCIC